MTDVALDFDSALPDSALLTVARLHVLEIPDGFLTKLGEPFLCQVYGAIVDHQESFLIGAHSEGQLIGFICGSTDTAALYRAFVFSRGFSAARALFPSAFSFRVMKGMVETFMYPQRAIPGLPKAAILNFAVDPDARGQGVGTRLLHALGSEFRRRGEGPIRIVCGEEQVAAQRLYLRNGATEVCSIQLHSGVTSKVLVWDVALASAKKAT